jgi:hypothetical protein
MHARLFNHQNQCQYQHPLICTHASLTTKIIASPNTLFVTTRATTNSPCPGILTYHSTLSASSSVTLNTTERRPHDLSLLLQLILQTCYLLAMKTAGRHSVHQRNGLSIYNIREKFRNSLNFPWVANIILITISVVLNRCDAISDTKRR